MEEMTQDEFLTAVSSLGNNDICLIATTLMKARGLNRRHWNIKVYPDGSFANYSEAVLTNDDELKFWCFIDEFKTTVLTSIFKNGDEIKQVLSCPLEEFGNRKWFDSVEESLKEKGWV